MAAARSCSPPEKAFPSARLRPAPGNVITPNLVRHGADVNFQSTLPLGQPGTPSIQEPAVQIH